MRKIALYSLGLLLVTSTLAATAPVTAAKTVKLRWTMWRAQPEEERIWKSWADEFEKLHPGVKISMEFPGDYIGQMLVSTAAGTASDVVRVNTEFVVDWAARGIIRPLDDFIKRDKTVAPDDWYRAVREMASYNGKVYGIPSDYSTYMVFYSPTSFNEAGVPAPSIDDNDTAWTWESFTLAAKKLAQYDSNGTVKRWGFANGELERLYSSLLWQNGGRYFNAGKNDIAFQSSEATEAMQFISDLVLKHKVMPLPSKLDYRDSFQRGKIAMIMDGNWMKSTFSLKKNFQYSGALMPLKKTRASWVTTSLWAMSPLSKNKDLAWEFISFISSMEKHMEMDKWGSDTGILLPPMKAAYKLDKWAPGPVTKAAVRQLEHGNSELIPQMAAFYQLVWPQVTKVMEQKVEPKAALDQIAAAAKRIVAKNKKK